jgi:hypothetical protein
MRMGTLPDLNWAMMLNNINGNGRRGGGRGGGGRDALALKYSWLFHDRNDVLVSLPLLLVTMQRAGGPTRRNERAGQRISIALCFTENNCLGNGIRGRNIPKHLKEKEATG